MLKAVRRRVRPAAGQVEAQGAAAPEDLVFQNVPARPHGAEAGPPSSDSRSQPNASSSCRAASSGRAGRRTVARSIASCIRIRAGPRPSSGRGRRQRDAVARHQPGRRGQVQVKKGAAAGPAVHQGQDAPQVVFPLRESGAGRSPGRSVCCGGQARGCPARERHVRGQERGCGRKQPLQEGAADLRKRAGRGTAAASYRSGAGRDAGTLPEQARAAPPIPRRGPAQPRALSGRRPRPETGRPGRRRGRSSLVSPTGTKSRQTPGSSVSAQSLSGTPVRTWSWASCQEAGTMLFSTQSVWFAACRTGGSKAEFRTNWSGCGPQAAPARLCSARPVLQPRNRLDHLPARAQVIKLGLAPGAGRRRTGPPKPGPARTAWSPGPGRSGHTSHRRRRARRETPAPAASHPHCAIRAQTARSLNSHKPVSTRNKMLLGQPPNLIRRGLLQEKCRVVRAPRGEKRRRRTTGPSPARRASPAPARRLRAAAVGRREAQQDIAAGDGGDVARPGRRQARRRRRAAGSPAGSDPAAAPSRPA